MQITCNARVQKALRGRFSRIPRLERYPGYLQREKTLVLGKFNPP